MGWRLFSKTLKNAIFGERARKKTEWLLLNNYETIMLVKTNRHRAAMRGRSLVAPSLKMSSEYLYLIR